MARFININIDVVGCVHMKIPESEMLPGQKYIISDGLAGVNPELVFIDDAPQPTRIWKRKGSDRHRERK